MPRLIEARKPNGDVIEVYEINDTVSLVDHVYNYYKSKGYDRYIMLSERKIANGEKILVVKSVPSQTSRGRIIEFHTEKK